MIDETGTPNPATPNAETSNSDSKPTGFCQDCGRPLTPETLRQVGSGVFCDPCLERRAGTGPIPGAAYATGSGYVPPHVPKPALAGWLGLIPGVGAMYNGQFAKGIAHLLVFAVLSSLSDHGNGLFGLLCFGWICYQSFEAYHTAKARLLGLPLPNPFGLNDIGERLGFNKGWQYGGQPYGGQTAGAQQGPPPAGAQPAADWSSSFAGAWTRSGGAWPFDQGQPQAQPQPQPQPPAPAASNSDWTGYVPPTAFGSTAVPPVVPTPESWGSTPYHAAPPTQSAYTPLPFYQAAPGVVVPPIAARTRRFPAGAIWLIGLGALFLLMNLDAHFDLRGSWLVAAILAAVAIWSLTHGHAAQAGSPQDAYSRQRYFSRVVRFPTILLVLAGLFVLQGAHWFTLGQTWPVLLLTIGGLMLAERALPRADVPLAGAGYESPVEPIEPNDAHDDAAKGGQA